MDKYLITPRPLFQEVYAPNDEEAMGEFAIMFDTNLHEYFQAQPAFNDPEMIMCPKCGKALELMDPFYDTEENEFNYHCDDCNIDITFFDKNMDEGTSIPRYADVIAWIAEHEVAWEDFKHHFHITEEQEDKLLW